MKDQHKHIKGYRDLTEEEITLMNDIKREGERLKLMLELLRKPKYDQRWVDIAETQLQIGIMTAVRAVAQPEGF